MAGKHVWKIHVLGPKSLPPLIKDDIRIVKKTLNSELSPMLGAAATERVTDVIDRLVKAATKMKYGAGALLNAISFDSVEMHSCGDLLPLDQKAITELMELAAYGQERAADRQSTWRDIPSFHRVMDDLRQYFIDNREDEMRYVAKLKAIQANVFFDDLSNHWSVANFYRRFCKWILNPLIKAVVPAVVEVKQLSSFAYEFRGIVLDSMNVGPYNR